MALNYSILKSCNRPEIKQDFCHQQWLCLIQGDIHKWSQCLQQLLLLFIKKTKPMWKLNQRLFSDFPLQQTKVLFPAVSCRFQLQFHRHVGLQTDCWCLAVDTGNRKFVKSWSTALGSSYAGLKYLHVFQGHPLPLQVHFPRLFWTWWPNRYPAGPERNEIERPMSGAFLSVHFCRRHYTSRRVNPTCEVSVSGFAVWSKATWGQNPWDRHRVCAEIISSLQASTVIPKLDV